MDAIVRNLQYQLKWKPALIVVAVFCIFWFIIPCPAGVDPKGWKILAVFLATIVGLLTKPMPMGALVLLALAFLPLTKTLAVGETFAALGNPSVWLIVMAFFISRGFAKTGLGRRIGYIFIRKLGHTTLGLAYSVCFTQYVLGPAMPSGTARSCGTIMPMVISLAKAFGSDPEKGTQRTIGSYLMLTAFVATFPVSAAFLTAMPGNILAASLAAAQGVHIDWLTWAWGLLVPALAGMCIVPISMYYLYPPEIKKSPEARKMAEEKLQEMGPMTLPEKFMLGTFICLLLMWIVGSYTGLNATVAALIGILFLVCCGVLTWDDVLSEKGAYDSLFWFSGIIFMASGLTKYGVVKVAAGVLGNFATSFSWPIALFILVVTTLYGGYFIASSTAFASATYAAFLAIALAAGAPPLVAALIIIAFCSVQAMLTWYSSGIGAPYLASGYIETNDWLRLGFISSLLQLVAWLGSGAIWWKLIGYY